MVNENRTVRRRAGRETTAASKRGSSTSELEQRTTESISGWRQGAQAPEKEHGVEGPAEEDADMGTKDDQDRKRQADDTIEQNDQSPPKRGVGRPVKKVLPHPEEKDTRLQRMSRRKSQSQSDVLAPPANLAAGREESRESAGGRHTSEASED